MSTRRKISDILLPVLLVLTLCCSSASFAQVDTTESGWENYDGSDDEEYTDTDYDEEEENDKAVFTETIFQDSLVLSKREVDRKAIGKLKESDAFWYADFEPEPEKKPGRQELRKANYTPFMQQTWFQTLLWLVIVGGFAAGIAIFLANSNVNLFRRKNTVFTGAGEEPETDDIFAINYQKEIDRAVNAKNFRLAVRLMYLRLLKEMADRNIIRYSQGKTNFDYLADLGPTSYYRGFFRVTRYYEYAWYGQFEVNGETFSKISAEFNNMQKSFY